MTEETRTELNEIEDEFWRSDMTTYSLDVAVVAAYELGEKAGRSEKKDSLSTKHLHETE